MISIKDVENLAAGGTLWDRGKGACPSFGVRRQKGEARTYFVKYLFEGRQRWLTIGKHGALTPDLARKRAREILAEVMKGRDPQGAKEEARGAKTLADLIDDYIGAAEKGLVSYRGKAKKPSTVATDRGRLDRHVKPTLGNVKLSALARRDIERLKDAIASGATAARVKTGPRGLARVTGGKGTSTRTIATLAAVLSWGVKRGYLESNPAVGVETFGYSKRRRRATDDEYARLGDALRRMPETAWPPAVAAAQFVLLTGWRKSEVLGLRWNEVDAASRVALLADTKSLAASKASSQLAAWAEGLRDALQTALTFTIPAMLLDDRRSAAGWKPVVDLVTNFDSEVSRIENTRLAIEAARAGVLRPDAAAHELQRRGALDPGADPDDVVEDEEAA